jgi:hypothetical protein
MKCARIRKAKFFRGLDKQVENQWVFWVYFIVPWFGFGYRRQKLSSSHSTPKNEGQPVNLLRSQGASNGTADRPARIQHTDAEMDPQPAESQATVPVVEQLPRPPPPGEYVVFGIFDDSATLQEEVIVYVGGHEMSEQLVKERRRLFSLPILRDIKAFELYKASCSTPSKSNSNLWLCSAILKMERTLKWTALPKRKTVLQLCSSLSTSGRDITG